MSITKKELFKLCDENHDAINELRLQSDSTDFVLATLIQQLKDGGIISELGAEPQPQLKQLDQSIFDGLDEKWRFAGVDEDSRAFKFDCEPAINCDEWYEGHGQQKILIGEGYDASNWQDSLIERESKELTGSELCRAMLERGDKYVMCKTSGTGEAEAMEAKYPDVIQKYDWEFFYTPYKKRYAVPINNQGEPLTASEAGL